MFWMLGASMAIPVILASGPLAGYLLGQWLFVNYFKLPGAWVGGFVLLGFAGSVIQIVKLIRRMKDIGSQSDV